MPPSKITFDPPTDAPTPVLREDGFEADIGKEHTDTFRHVQHPDLRANPPFNDSDTALRGSAFLQSEAKPQVVSEAKDNFRKDDDVRWQPIGARQIAKGNPQGERGGVHQFGVPPKTARRDSANTNPEGKPQVVSGAKDNNANFAWVQHFIHHLAPQGMAGLAGISRGTAPPLKNHV